LNSSLLIELAVRWPRSYVGVLRGRYRLAFAVGSGSGGEGLKYNFSQAAESHVDIHFYPLRASSERIVIQNEGLEFSAAAAVHESIGECLGSYPPDGANLYA
jgi:hypothetical protein